MKLVKWTAIIHTLFALLLLAGIARADWTGAEIGKEVGWQVLHLIDWGTTLDIADNPDRYYEGGPAMIFIGRHPSRSEVNLYMGIGAIVHPIITHILPRRYNLWGWETKPKAWFQNVSLIGSGACVANNIGIGLKVAF